MDASLFLAKVIGLYLLIISVSMILNGKSIRPILLNLIKTPPLLFLSGFIALIIGLLLVVSHNIWVMDWRLIITLIAWLALVKGVIRVGFPEHVVRTSEKYVKSNAIYYTSFSVLFILGLILVYFGFAH